MKVLNLMSGNAVLQINMKRICFIDDSKTSAFVTKKMLRQHGYAVDHFPDAESALEALMENDYALIITDLMISSDGGVNGDDLIRIVRHSGHAVKSRIPIVVVTGTGDQDVLKDLIKVGANKVLQKPLDSESLNEAVQSLIQLPENTNEPEVIEASVIETDSVETRLEETRIKEARAEEARNVATRIKAPDFSDIELDVSPDLLNEPVLNPESSPKTKLEVSLEPESPISSAENIQLKDLETDSLPGKVDTAPDSPVVENTSPAQDTSIPVQDTSVTKNAVPVSSFSMNEYISELPVQTNTETIVGTDKSSKIKNDESLEIPVLTRAVSGSASPNEAQSIGSEIENLLAADLTSQSNTKTKTETEKKQATQKSQAPVEDNPLLALLDHMDDESLEEGFNKTPAKPLQRFKLNKWAPKAVLGAIILVVLVPAISFWLMTQKVIEVTTLSVEKGPIYSQISVPGRIDSKRKIKVSAREGGQLVKVLVNEGDLIKKGQILAQLDDSEEISNIKRAEARLLSVEEEVSLTSKTQERLQRALDVGAVSRQMVEDAEANWKSASARQSVIEEEFKSAKLKRDRLKIRGAFDGVVTEVFAQEGQWVSQSENLFSLIDMQQRVVEILVDASDSASLNIDQTVVLRSGAFDGLEWTESIIKIGSAANNKNSANVIKVTASFSKDSPELRVGQQVDAEIRTNSKADAMLLPMK